MPYNTKRFAKGLQRSFLFCLALLPVSQSASATPGGLLLNCENLAILVEQDLLTREEADSFVRHQAYVATITRLEDLVFLPYWSEETVERIRHHVDLPPLPEKKGKKRKTSTVILSASPLLRDAWKLGNQPLKLTYREAQPRYYNLGFQADKSKKDSFKNFYGHFSLLLHEEVLGKRRPVSHVMLGKYNVKVGPGLLIAGDSSNQNRAPAYFTRQQHQFVKPCGSKVRNNGLEGLGAQGTQGPYTWVIFVSQKDYYANIKKNTFSSIPKKNDAYEKQLEKGSFNPIHEKLLGGMFRRQFAQGHLGLELLGHDYSHPHGYPTKKKDPADPNTRKKHRYMGCFGRAEAGLHHLMGSIALSGNGSFAMVVGDKITFDKKKKSYLALVAEYYAPYFYNLHGNRKTNEQNLMVSLGHAIYGYPAWADLKYHGMIKSSLQTKRKKRSLAATLNAKTSILRRGQQTHILSLGETTSSGGKRGAKVTYKVEHYARHNSFNFKTVFSCGTNLLEKFTNCSGKLGQSVVYQQNKLKLTLQGDVTYAYGTKKKKQERRGLWLPALGCCLGILYELCAGVRLKLNLNWGWKANGKGVFDSFWDSLTGIKATWQISCDL